MHMAKIKWAELCELAFIDKYERLCIVGVTTRFAVPSLPIAVRQIMIAARIADYQPADTFAVGVTIAMPDGRGMSPNQTDCMDISIEGEYLLITLRDIPLSEEGVHTFEVSIGDHAPVKLEFLVGLVPKRIDSTDQKAGASIVKFESTPRPAGRDVN